PGNGTIVATSDRRKALVKEAAKHLMRMIEDDVKPRDIITKEAIDDAFALDMAMGGSTNTVLHTLAIADEAEIDYDLAEVNKVAERVPYLAKIMPASDISLDDMNKAGGVEAIIILQKNKAFEQNTIRTVQWVDYQFYMEILHQKVQSLK